jgi:hypothetical protein
LRARATTRDGKGARAQQRLKFNYSPIEHYQAFVRLLAPEASQRTFLDTYFSSFFQAWVPGTGKARYVAGFVPRIAMHEPSIPDFFKDYPDGRLISILRDPADWFASRRAHTKQGQVRYDNVEEEMSLWNRMAQLALNYRSAYGEQFLLLSFKELVTDRESTMRRVCSWCGIEFDPCLLEQTFDGGPISPSTNFDDPIERLAEAVLDRKQ